MDVMVRTSGTLLGVKAALDVQVTGGPVTVRLTASTPISLSDIWNALRAELATLGIDFPAIPQGPWSVIFDQHVLVSAWVSPASVTAVAIELAFVSESGTPEPFEIGGTTHVGPLEVTLSPNLLVNSLYIKYASGTGLALSANVSTPTSAGPSALGAPPSPGPTVGQMVSYPFPLPAQNAVSAFKLNYFGIGQRVGPDPYVGNEDPLTYIFEEVLEKQLFGTDPTEILTTLAQHFYHPDRGWFVAADLSLSQWRLRLLFNDPSLYGLQVIGPGYSPPNFFSGFLFEILYQKLGPNLGVYYGALNLPEGLRRIPLEGAILILPGFSIWVYTNGDFRVNIGWPLGPQSIGLQLDVLLGQAGLYFAKLRSGDDPGLTPSVNYNPILEFGIAISVGAVASFNASVLSASLSVCLSASLQGLLAWEADSTGGAGSIANLPDLYWFAGTAAIAVDLQGCVDFRIIKASVSVMFTANLAIALQTGHSTVIAVSAYVSVSVSIKVIFFTIHLSFHTTVSKTFTIGSGPPASPAGPLGVDGIPPMLTAVRSAPWAPALAIPSRFSAWDLGQAGQMPIDVGLWFVLQPTAVYDESGGRVALVASLVADCPPPGAPPLTSPGAATGFEALCVALAQWLLSLVPPTSPPEPLSVRLSTVAAALGSGNDSPSAALFGGQDGFTDLLRAWLEQQVRFVIQGVQQTEAFDHAAMLPMFDRLILDVPGASPPEVDFGAGQTPAAYETAIDCYFTDVGLVGPPPPTGNARALPTSGPAVATLVFGDYYLLICRQLISQLVELAQQYERSEAQDDELDFVLDHVDYSNVAGMGSRFLLSGLQLPIPADIPPDPTPDNMVDVATAGLFILTGQQFPAPGGSSASASLRASATAPAGAFVFDPPSGAVATLMYPDPAPAKPSPAWSGVVPPSGTGPDQIEIVWAGSVVSAATVMSLRNQASWLAPEGARLAFPLPGPLMTLATAGEILLELQGEDASPPPTMRAALRIPLGVARVPGNTEPWAPYVYELSGTDEDTRALLRNALEEGVGDVTLTFVYTPDPTSGARADRLQPDVLITKVNLSTLNQAAQVSASALALLRSLNAADLYSAVLGDPADFLLLVWELSVVQAQGYYLYYRTTAGDGFPDEMFADTASGSPGVSGPVPGTGTAASPITLFVEGPAAPGLTRLPPWANCLIVEGVEEKSTLTVAVLDASGQPVPSWSPSQAPGSIGMIATCTTVPVSPGEDLPLSELYQSLQYRVLGEGVYRTSPWSLPASPTDPQDAAAYADADAGASPPTSRVVQRAVPLAPFLSGGSPRADVYGVVGHPAQIMFRLADVYGNALPDTHVGTVTPLYTDPLIAISTWPGVVARHSFGTARVPQAAALELDLVFDVDALYTSGSPGVLAPDPLNAITQCYGKIAQQLADPAVTASITTTLASDLPLADPRAALSAFVQEILALLADPAASPGGVRTRLDALVPWSAVADLANNIVRVEVAVQLSRPTELVDPDALARIPAVGALACPILPNTDGSGSPGTVAAYAQTFEAAFEGFDGAQGCLKLAQRSSAPLQSGAELWCVRFSAAAGIDVTFPAAASASPTAWVAYYAVPPLETKPRDGTVDGVTYSGIDLDAWARSFLTAVDSILAPELAAAMAALDKIHGTDFYESLLTSKAALASAIPQRMAPVLQDEWASGDLTAARDRLEQALLERLASAYDVSTVLQVAAEVHVQGTADAASPTRPPELFGSLLPQETTASDARQYAITGGSLVLETGPQWLTSLVSVSNPSLQSHLDLSPGFSATFLQHDFDIADANDGYVPSSWLKFILPDRAPLVVKSIAGALSIPIPLPFQPSLPRLLGQSATAASVSPTGGGSVAQIIEEALGWAYSAEVAVNVGAQDQLYMDVQYNGGDTSSFRMLAASPLDGLFSALARFLAESDELIAKLPDIVQEAFGGHGSPTLVSPSTGIETMRRLADLVQGVADAWKPLEVAPLTRASSPGWTDHFYLQRGTDGTPPTLDIFGRTLPTGSTVWKSPSVWPVISIDGATAFIPTGPGTPADGWFAQAGVVPRVAPESSAWTLTWSFAPIALGAAQQADCATWLTRNKDLLHGHSTNPSFVYTTQKAYFADPVVPFIRCADLPTADPGTSLLDALSQLLAPLAALGPTLDAEITVGVSYRYALVAEFPALVATQAVMLVAALALTGNVASGMASEISAWREAQPALSSADALLCFTITVYGEVDGIHRLLVDIPALNIDVHAVPSTWWTA